MDLGADEQYRRKYRRGGTSQRGNGAILEFVVRSRPGGAIIAGRIHLPGVYRTDVGIERQSGPVADRSAFKPRLSGKLKLEWRDRFTLKYGNASPSSRIF